MAYVGQCTGEVCEGRLRLRLVRNLIRTLALVILYAVALRLQIRVQYMFPGHISRLFGPHTQIRGYPCFPRMLLIL